MASKQVYCTEDVIDFLSGVKDFPLSDNDSEAFFQDEQTEHARPHPNFGAHVL